MSRRLRWCACPAHPGCTHHPGRCTQPPGDLWAANHCKDCGRWRTAAIAAGLAAMQRRRPQDELATYERSTP